MRARYVGFKELERAVRRFPSYTKARANLFITRGLAEYRRVIFRNPWPMGTYSVAGGGGAPVDTGNLRDTHQQHVSNLEGLIGPNLQAAPYALPVHEGTRYLHARPWLDYARQKADSRIRAHQRELLDDLVSRLAQ